jgi:hypothetical protein
VNNTGNRTQNKQENTLMDKYHMGENLSDSETNELLHSQVLKLVNAGKKSHIHISHISDPKLRKDLETSLSTWEKKELEAKIATTEEIKAPL